MQLGARSTADKIVRVYADITLRHATPEEYEDAKAYRSGGEASTVTERFHLARKIAALWSEEDAFARTRQVVGGCGFFCRTIEAGLIMRFWL